MTARYLIADVFDGLATLEDGAVDLVVTSPPFGWLRSYLPADHPDKHREIGQEENPAAFIDVLLKVTADLRRVLAPHGSIAVELGDTYSGTGGAGGDWSDSPNTTLPRIKGGGDGGPPRRVIDEVNWPLAKSKTLIPELYRIALAYGINPLTGAESPAGRWRVRNNLTWCRPNPPVGALGDKWRPATSDVVVACTSDKRYWDDIATRRPLSEQTGARQRTNDKRSADDYPGDPKRIGSYDPEAHSPTGAPLLDWWPDFARMTLREAIQAGIIDPGDAWEIPPGGFKGAHYAVFPPALVEPLIKAMAPPKVCRQCGEPVRRIVGEATYGSSDRPNAVADGVINRGGRSVAGLTVGSNMGITRQAETLGWSDCGHDNWRPALILDPFAGSGTTLSVATGHGHDAIGIDLDPRNMELARDRVGPLWFNEATL